jgi:hypothetical protein
MKITIDTLDSYLDFHAIPPLDGCTYEGIDSGSQPNQVQRIRNSFF